MSRCVILPAWLEFRIVGRLRVEVYLCNRSRIAAACATRSERTYNCAVCRKMWEIGRSILSRKDKPSRTLVPRKLIVSRRSNAEFSSSATLFDYLVNVGRMKRGARGSWKYWKCECAFAPSFCASDFRSSFSISSEISTSGNLCKWQISAFVKLRDRRLNLRKHNESFPRVRLSSCW